jgi:hypothetical protein
MATHPRISYTDERRCPRELVVCPAAFGSLLVVDRDSTTLGDHRLLAHIPADEPPENAALVCRLYLEDAGVRSCRPLVREDFERAPFPRSEEHGGALAQQHGSGELVAHGRQLYCIRPRHSHGEEPPELRWSRGTAARCTESWAPITLRVALTDLESYEPMYTLTARAIARHEHDPAVSVDALRRELSRLRQSAFVLNRALREAVVDAVERRGTVSMSELALRCGMVKRDRRGLLVGDTSWLARRVGLMPAAGKSKPTRWVHVDVLALIARSGLGISPREVELG